MDLTKEKVAELKATHGEIYNSEYRWSDKDGQMHTLAFVYKKPVMAHLEMFQKESEKSPVIAQSNLMRNLIVYPEASDVMKKVEIYTSVIADFVTEEVVPFFGKVTERKSVKL
ncbi:MAG: DUF6848 family protein [Treponemataceae bacterium]